jgi:hypothetical protein
MTQETSEVDFLRTALQHSGKSIAASPLFGSDNIGISGLLGYVADITKTVRSLFDVTNEMADNTGILAENAEEAGAENEEENGAGGKKKGVQEEITEEEAEEGYFDQIE